MEPYTDTNTTTQSSTAIPIAIIVGFMLIAAAIFFSGNNKAAPVVTTETPTTNERPSTNTSTGSIRPVDSTDYIRGNPNAPIMLVEYSDYDCVFCKQYHDTMRMIMEDYGASSRVAWVYRQFPIVQMHPNSPRISEAALCVGELGGSSAFWKFSDLVLDGRDPSQPINMTRLPAYAETAGVSLSEYNECLDSGRQKPVVQASVDEALGIGADGTPYTVLLVGDQQTFISGAQPYAFVRDIIESLLRQIDGQPIAG